MNLNKDYWTERYLNQQTGWDIGYASPALIDYCKDIDKTCKILIPGPGNGYEAIELWNMGFTNVYVIDISEIPLKNLLAKCSDFPQNQLILGDFFDHKPQYNLILEQTFFCALDPILRSNYVEKMYELLFPGGKLAGVLFNSTFENPGPPFGGNAKDYQELFKDKFEFLQFEICKNSIKPRLGNELFIEFRKK